MRRLAAALAILALGVPAAPVAQAQIGPNAPSPLTQPPPPPPPAPQKFDEGGLSALQKLLIFGSAALVLAAIAFVIVRDARRSAPVGERPRGAADGPGGASRAARERERRQRARRARAKAARQQRKRNRSR
jgi:hypothetical protein